MKKDGRCNAEKREGDGNEKALAMRGLSFILAGATRLELATSGVTGRRSNQLNYAPSFLFLLPEFLSLSDVPAIAAVIVS